MCRKANSVQHFPDSRRLRIPVATQNPKGKITSKRFLLTFPDGSKKHVSRAERDTLLLARHIKPTSAGTYFWCGQVKTFHSFSELQNLQLSSPGTLRNFLPGFFIFEHKDQRKREFLESPEHLQMRLSHGDH